MVVIRLPQKDKQPSIVMRIQPSSVNSAEAVVGFELIPQPLDFLPESPLLLNFKGSHCSTEVMPTALIQDIVGLKAARNWAFYSSLPVFSVVCPQAEV